MKLHGLLVVALFGLGQFSISAATHLLTNANATAMIVADLARPDRGLMALVKSQREVYLGWRLLGVDAADGAFNIFRATDGGAAVRLNP
ncbi:MAG: hypothetical protein LCH60_13360, partial [Actinobacteria bacterium]|nr:hypothetical protein [Actinomycetota bacterium]